MSSAWLNQRHSISIYIYMHMHKISWLKSLWHANYRKRWWVVALYHHNMTICLLIWLYLSWEKRVFNQGATRQSSQFLVRTIDAIFPRILCITGGLQLGSRQWHVTHIERMSNSQLSSIDQALKVLQPNSDIFVATLSQSGQANPCC